LTKRDKEAGDRQNEISSQWKLKVEQKQNEVDLREADINRIKRILENRDNEL